MKKTILATALGFSVIASAAAADLLPGDKLLISSGSYFTMGGGAYGTIPLMGENHLVVGSALGNTGSGSHGGSPAATDVGAVTMPWSFFYNTGYEFLSVNHGSGSFGGDTTNGVDMTSWAVTWNGIAEIPMGGCYLLPGGCTQGSTVFNDTGIGAFSWDGVYGDTYTIDYRAHIPVGDPTNFGGIQYDVHLTGLVIRGGEPLPPTTNVTIRFPDGRNFSCEAGGATVTANVNITTSDDNDIVSVDWALDGASVGSGNSVTTFVPVGTHDFRVVVNTLASGQYSNTQPVTIKDDSAPVITAGFISTQTGEEVTVLSDGVKSALESGNITVQYTATDKCDSNPHVEATLGIDVVDQDKVKLNRGVNKLMLQGDTLSNSVVMTVSADDAAGHHSLLKKVLSQ